MTQFKERREQYFNEIDEATQQTEVGSNLIDIKERYHQDLIKIMQKTKNPELFASIVNENVPMDMTCVTACTHAIHGVLEPNGMYGCKIIVTEESGFKQTFSSTDDNNEAVVVNLTLKDNYFTFAGSLQDGDNNCLFHTLKEQIPALNDMSPDMFRTHIVDKIRNDTTIHDFIKKGWHQFAPTYFSNLSTRKDNRREYISTNEIKRDIENDPKNPNKEYTGPNFHIYNSKKDVDLRINKKLSTAELHKQRAEAYDTAKVKINEKVAEIQNGISNPVTLGESSFKTTHDSVLMRSRDGSAEVEICPVAKQAILQVQTKVEKTVKKYTLTAEINLNNADSASIEQGPNGPHVSWSVSGFGKRTVGHVLLNREGNEFIPRREKGSIHVQSFKSRNTVIKTALKRNILTQFTNFQNRTVNNLDVQIKYKHNVRARRNSFTICDI